MAQWISASLCEGEGRRFESSHPHFAPDNCIHECLDLFRVGARTVKGAVCKAVLCRFNSDPALYQVGAECGSVTQRSEYLSFKQRAGGSNPLASMCSECIGA